MLLSEDRRATEKACLESAREALRVARSRVPSEQVQKGIRGVNRHSRAIDLKSGSQRPPCATQPSMCHAVVTSNQEPRRSFAVRRSSFFPVEMGRMTHNQPYRVREATFAILSLDGSCIPVTLPVDAIVLVIDGPLDGNRLVEIIWERRTLLMFTHVV